MPRKPFITKTGRPIYFEVKKVIGDGVVQLAPFGRKIKRPRKRTVAGGAPQVEGLLSPGRLLLLTEVQKRMNTGAIPPNEGKKLAEEIVKKRK